MTALHRSAPDPIGKAEAEEFLIHEARLLDEQRYDEWMNLFAPDAYYWAPARAGQPDPHAEVSLIFDDREIMQQRIKRLRHPRIFAQLPPSRAVRQVTNVTVDDVDHKRGECTARSVFFMYEFRPTLPEPIQRIFAGEYRHCLRRSGNGLLIAWKKALLVNCDASFDPIFLYF